MPEEKEKIPIGVLQNELDFRNGKICECWRDGIPATICKHEVAKFRLNEQ